ncbi:TPA: hypothetical protein DDZ86_01085 [Candidatus Dependentiae bacterium]|nr:MAG: hypothetical protein UW09_C0004G0098 [candidate division TM6 bacterium GW2011_GWF2_43_87]HBL98220.1 hypothetical protein [Candidatus Dependentiae bacterium]
MILLSNLLTREKAPVKLLYAALLCLFTLSHGMQNNTPLPIVFLSESEGNYPDSFKLLKDEIVKKYPNVSCTTLVLGDGKPEIALQNLESIIDLIEQAWTKQIANKIKSPVMAIGSSQSALTLRFWIEKYLHKHLINYKDQQISAIFHAILVCGMQAGYYGIPEDKKAQNHLEETCATLQSQSITQILNHLTAWQKFLLFGSTLSSIASNGLVSAGTPLLYKPEIQEKSSFAGFWKDPMALKKYKNCCAVLPRYNNELDHSDSEQFIKNISAVNFWNFFGASEDPKILPPQSALFRFYKKGSSSKIKTSFEETAQYRKNLLGFKTLYNQKRAFFTEVDTDQHGHQNPKMIEAIMNAINEGQKQWNTYSYADIKK